MGDPFLGVGFLGFAETFQRAHEEELEDLGVKALWTQDLSQLTGESLSVLVVNLDDPSLQQPALWEALRDQWAHTERVAICTRDSAQWAMHCLREGFNDYLTQPVSPDELVLALLRCRQRMISRSALAGPVGEMVPLFTAITSCSSTATLRVRTLGVLQRLLEARRAVWITRTSAAMKRRRVVRTSDGLRRVWLPCRRKTHGAFVLEGIPGPVSRTRLDQAMQLVEHAELVQMNLNRVERLKALTLVDDLTGLYNSRYLRFALESAVRESSAGSKTFGLLFLDIDHFKKVNDSHGHLVGSAFLSALGKIIKNAVRTADLVFRYGGDEFVVLLKDASKAQALEIAERLRAHISKRGFSIRKVSLRSSLSIGIALFPEHGTSAQTLIERADEAMYQAKRVRNKVCLASQTTPQTKPRPPRPLLEPTLS